MKSLLSLLRVNRKTEPMPVDMLPTGRATRPVSFHVTLWPAFPHFVRFATHPSVQGIRLNSAMMAASEIDDVFVDRSSMSKVPLWFDVKGMQMRVREIVCGTDKDHLEFILNRPVKVKTPCPVWFKGGEDCAKLIEVKNGTHFIFEGGPRNEVRAGESIHILESEFEVGGPLLLDYEIEKVEKIKKLGFKRWYLSYVYDQRHVDEFREVIGNEAELILKIENKPGLRYVVEQYHSMPYTHLMAARGDLFVEVDRAHHIMQATKLIVDKDPDAFVGSRMLLSLVKSQIPSSSDLCELAWLYDVGFRNFLLCDELCLQEGMLGCATAVFEAFRKDYCHA